MSTAKLTSTGLTSVDLVIFDCDGVLVDSERISNEVLAEVLAEHGIALSWEEAKATFLGQSVGDVRTNVARRFGVEMPLDWSEAYYGRMIPALAERVEAIDGASVGSAGVASLARSIASARELGFAIILDAKRGDIGSTAEAYARAYLEPGASDLEVDCLTINPFLGPETLEPFVQRARDFGKGLFVLVKTSNPGSGWLQDQQIGDESVSARIADLVAGWAEETRGASGVGAVGAVVGATYPAQGQALRRLLPRSVLLAPGLGEQGGDPAAITALATPSAPVLISASRGIAAVEDRGIPLEDYKALVRERIAAFQADISAPVL